jgi:cell wall-active antibiotic response 4TMS protein YvqF
MADERSGFRLTPHAVLGLLIVVLGLLLTADNLGWVHAQDFIWKYWPMILVVVGLTKLLQGSGGGRLVGGFVMLIGLGLEAERVFDVDIDAWWPMLLVALGLIIVSRATRGPRQLRTEPDTTGDIAQMGQPNVSSTQTASFSNEANVSEFAMWAGKQRRLSSVAFRRADLTAIMGGIELDLRQASTATGEAIVDVFAMWGGIEIFVPPDWAVSNQVSLLMAGAEDKSSGTQDARNRLIVRGFILMGGLEIKT